MKRNIPRNIPIYCKFVSDVYHVDAAVQSHFIEDELLRHLVFVPYFWFKNDFVSVQCQSLYKWAALNGNHSREAPHQRRFLSYFSHNVCGKLGLCTKCNCFLNSFCWTKSLHIWIYQSFYFQFPNTIAASYRIYVLHCFVFVRLTGISFLGTENSHYRYATWGLVHTLWLHNDIRKNSLLFIPLRKNSLKAQEIAF